MGMPGIGREEREGFGQSGRRGEGNLEVAGEVGVAESGRKLGGEVVSVKMIGGMSERGGNVTRSGWGKFGMDGIRKVWLNDGIRD